MRIKLLIYLMMGYLVFSCGENEPQLWVSTTEIKFEVGVTKLNFTVENIGGGEMEVNVLSNLPVESHPTHFTLKANESTAVTITLQERKGGQILVTTTKGGQTTINVLVESPPKLWISTENLRFGEGITTQEFTVRNDGGGQMKVRIHSDVVDVPLSRFTLGEGETKTVVATLKAQVEGNILVTTDIGDETIIRVLVKNVFTSQSFTAPGGFTSGIEGPACDAEGNLYAVNYARQHTIGKVTSQGECSIFVELLNGSIGNGIRFSRAGFMLIADYINHNILKVDMKKTTIGVYAHEPTMNQPNDIAIGANDILYASDPNWANSTGQIWRIDTDGTVTLLETNMGTTNGIEVSPDEKTLYVNESVQRNIWAYALSEEGEISHKRLLIQFPDFGMDGMRCDVAGNLYVTRHGKGTVAKISPEGEVLLEIQLTGKLCTNVAFGGEDGRTCYVTIADRGNIESFRTDLAGRSWQLFHKH